MRSSSPIHVLKFGSSILRSAEDLPVAVHEIYRHWRAGERVLAVVSAFGSTTDDLLARAEQLGLPPQPEATAALLATGEATAAALLTLALARAGLQARLLDPHHAGLIAEGDFLDGRLVAVDIRRILRRLDAGIVVVPGFVGRHRHGGIALLGRGGSDLTALFLARALDARCTLLKDVDGLHSADPKAAGGEARRFSSASWRTAAALGGELVQSRAVGFAEDHRKGFRLSSPGSLRSTEVGAGPDEREPLDPADAAGAAPPLRVALLGCGAVGGGVLAHLLRQPDHYQVIGVAVRDVGKSRGFTVPPELLTTDVHSLVEKDADVVVELLGGREPAAGLIAGALDRGRHVVTANKALLAEEGEFLLGLARRRGVSLRFSASVGGALPALETVRRIAREEGIRAISGVLNGTCNFVLDRCAAGVSLAEAVDEARAAGFAEADPALDLDGSDAAQKLALLAREAFGETLDWRTIPRRGIAGLTRKETTGAARAGRVLRLVAVCARRGTKLRARVALRAFRPSHPCARVRGAGNVLRVKTNAGRVHSISAHGAGRWPTSEAVLADLNDLRAERAQPQGVRDAACGAEVFA